MITLVLLGWLPIALLATYGVHLYRSRVAGRFAAPAASGIVVVIPVKGAVGGEEALERFLASCLAQRGMGYRLVFAVESPDDPATAPLVRLADGNDDVAVVIAGRATMRGQKIHNQLAALARLREGDDFVVFADADVRFAEDWLSQLLRPLTLGQAEIASGYRWILPADSHPASRACALIDWGVATAPRDRRWNLCWGGSMAVTRATLDRLDLPRLWNRALLDDIVLTNAARRLGIDVHAPHRVLVPSPVRHSWRSLFDFGRRQYLLVRVHAPGHWALAGVTLAIPTLAGGLALAAALQGDAVGIAALAVAASLQQLRATLRGDIARRVLQAEQAGQSLMLLRQDRWSLPMLHLLHLAIWLTSAFGRTMTWSGTRYRLLGPGLAEIIAAEARNGLERAKGIEPS